MRLLDALAPGVTRFAVHVHARSGRIAAAVRDQQVDGLTPRGADWLPPAAAPARQQVLPGVAAGAGRAAAAGGGARASPTRSSRSGW